MHESQLLKGILEGCILAIIADGETYGYEILTRLEKCGFEALLEGTLYPILTRLEKKELISCRKEKSPYGPIRKYYSITPNGRASLKLFKASYEKILTAADKVLRGEADE